MILVRLIAFILPVFCLKTVLTLHKKWSFPLTIWQKCDKKSGDLVTFTEEILIENFILCAV